MKFLNQAVFSATVLGCALALGQTQASTSQPQPNTIFVGADGKFDASPDTAVMAFHISAQESKSRAAYQKASVAADHVRDVLKTNGIDPKAAEIGFYSVQPIYDWKSSKRKIIAYRVTANVTVKLRDFSKVGDITEQTADLEGVENQALTYILENTEPAKQKAAEDAMRKARNEAAAVATAGGRSLGDLLYSSVDIIEREIPHPISTHNVNSLQLYDKSAGLPPPPPPPPAEFTPEVQTIEAHVNAMFTMK